ncbi:Heparan-alpha-glucosaminide N-acetyltransferase [Tripterygium wilfordii]|uniref:Heparan-alpha-glucosaminide N-acetyltransferase n=1 Tax=Tripterygium wilfordii TaxID=458696 RepID=A0A7J7DJ18_TRIWF|nr:heparan-alpha-glucosaminide N-acetyltransferase-like [Tripterygium wilfordii]KAF5746341.1 Heparan-alpha-glucosaminide N-acetyltransferase [Tripterygium wilfordii]
MGMYEPIKGGEDDFETRNRNSLMRIDNGDVESAIQISNTNNACTVIMNKEVEEKDPLVLSPSNSNKHHHHHRHNQPPQQQRQQQRQPRLVSLDVFRGLTVALMILVDDVGGLVPAINHSPWNGLTLADLVMPFFLFIVGVALGLTYKKLSCRTSATKKATLRALKLLLVGIVLQGGFFHGINNLTYGVDIRLMRLMGVLQRIALAYIVAAACEIWLKGEDDTGTKLLALKKYRFQWVVVLVLSVIYLSLLYGLYVPDWEYQIPVETSSSAPKIFSVKCGTRGNTGPACNAVGMIDRKVLGIRHLYLKPVYARTKQCSINSPDYGPLPSDAPSWCQAPFDPEGILSSVMAITTCLVGLHYGHIIVHFKDHWDRILHWTIVSSCLVVLGLGLDFFGMHINKALYTFSYMCVTGGAAGLLFTAIYVMVDVCGFRRVNMVFEWMGKHALMIYVLAACNVLPVMLQGFYWKQPQNNILSLIGIGK